MFPLVPRQCREKQLKYVATKSAGDVLAAVMPNLHTVFGPKQEPLVKSIILETKKSLELDDRDISPLGSESPGDKLLQLVDIVERREAIDPQSKPKEKFLNVLLNSKTEARRALIGVIKREFAKSVEIEELSDPQSEELEEEEAARFLSNSNLSSDKNFFRVASNYFKHHPIVCGFILGFVITFIMAMITLIPFFIGILVHGNSAEEPSFSASTQNEATVKTIVMSGIENYTESNFKAIPNVVRNHPLPFKEIPNTSTTAIEMTTRFEATKLPLKLVKEDTTVPNMRKRKNRITVSSYNEYTLVMGKVPRDRDIILSIKLESPVHWPSGNTMLINSFEIHTLSLDGPFAVDILVDIISKTPNLIHLRLKNTGNKLCQRNAGQLNLVKSIKSKFYLPTLRTMVLEDFTSCPEVYETLATFVEGELWQLKGFATVRSVLDDSNLVFIQQLLQLSRENLRQLVFSETKIDSVAPLFEVPSGLRLPQVNLVRLDSVSINGTKGLVPIGDKFSHIFPNLRTIVNSHGFLNWRNMSNLSDFKNLSKLEIGLNVPETHTDFSVSFLRRMFPALRKAKISLNFKQCHDEKIQLFGWETVRETLKQITLASNCKLYANFSQTPVQMRIYREEKYAIENYQYSFSYLLLDDRK